MAITGLPERYKRLEIPERVIFLDGNGELPKVEVKTPFSVAEVYLHGAHVTHFQRHNDAPLLFLSKFSRFADQQAIRGGIPFIFPWFGAREGEPMHGFARNMDWELKESLITPENAVRLRFTLPDSSEAALCPPFSIDYSVTIGDALTLEASIQNVSKDADFPFELCLHTYFAVADVASVSISGLKGIDYLDKVDNFAQKTEDADVIRIQSEVDRVYTDTTGTVEIADPGHRRRILVEKSGSRSTMVWNPWIAKAQQMPDFGSEEYLNMICVETGNIGKNKIILPPGASTTLIAKLSSHPTA